MSTYYKKLDQKCDKCGHQLQEVSIKSPFIDDYAIECTNKKLDKYDNQICPNAYKSDILYYRESAAARRECE